MCLKGTSLYRACFFFTIADEVRTVKLRTEWMWSPLVTFNKNIRVDVRTSNVKCWVVNHFKRIQHVFLVLDARQCWMKNLFWTKFNPIPSNMIFFFFYEMLDEIDAFKRIQHFVQHRKFRMLDEMLDPFKSVLSHINCLWDQWFKNSTVWFNKCWNNVWKLLFVCELSLAWCWSPVNKTYALWFLFIKIKKFPKINLVAHLTPIKLHF